MSTSPGEDDAGTADSREDAAGQRPAGKRPVAKRPAPKRKVGKRPSRPVPAEAAPQAQPEVATTAVDLLEPQESAPDLAAPAPEPDLEPEIGGVLPTDTPAEPEAEAPEPRETAVEIPDPEAEEPVVDDVERADEDAAPAIEDSALETSAVEDSAAEDPAPVSQAAAGAPPALVLRGVSRSYGGSTAVAGIDLTIPAGSFYGLVGPNGAGKTTTMAMIAGLLRPDRGEIQVGGIDLAKNPRAAKAMLGVLPDRLRTFDRLTGRQLLYYYGVLRGLKPAVVAQRTADLARAFDLTEALGRVVSDYSAGMTKKVMLAGAMIHSPRLLVLDEPFEAVDPVSSANILEILSAYVAHGGTVLLSSHGMDLIERVCTRVAVIVGGQLLAEGTVQEVRGEMTLEQRFVELSGEVSSMEGLEWLHTFSD
ncbi:ATP-binding cassette domain-containing protein [Microbacterium phosphatis]|uniref:ATP-binding cassette domain-containing protein n=1 Tax=Microbacterium phosphatis TaxID=3140248 RepID=UPI0031400E29